MYQFVENIEKNEYKDFYLKNGISFMQSYEWGLFNKKSRNQKPHYLGIKKDNKLVCVALLLEKKGPFKLSYFYCPRGFMIDYKNKELLTTFTKYLKEFIKKNNGIYLKVDPEIEYQEIDSIGNPIKDGYNNKDIYQSLISLDFKHTGFIKHFENNQPRYTFIIDLTKDLDELESNIHKSVLKKIKKTYDYNMTFRESTDTDTFYDLELKTSENDDFMPYSREYYKDALNIMNGTYKLFELVINPKQLYKDLTIKLENINKEENINKKKLNNINESKNRLNKELQELEPYKDKEELVICSQICAETKDTMWTLYIGNDKIGKNLYAVNRMYLEVIKYAKETNHKRLDLFGTTGDPSSAYKNLAGIHKFKQNFGGKYIEFIGEFDYINKKMLYKVLPIFLKAYRKLLKLKKKNT